jgi:hypothetical protein
MNALTFFTSSKTVWVSENFQNIFLNNYEMKDQQSLSAASSDLKDMKSETDVQKLLFKSVDAFLEELARLIEVQINGEDGTLLNDSSANYFFVCGKDDKNYSVLVRWESAQKLWRCGAYLQEDLKMPNIRIFYPA